MSNPASSHADDYTPASGASLRLLRAEMMERAAAIAARARSARARGDLVSARHLQQRAEQLADIARSVNVS